ncbi:MAG: IclR family transcriptional regulator [Homoserinimonas sp.]|jgi:IclR family pca regulon transcriptional regulator|nr:IclR family transcriptional regulator [Homoserinimonas sp.]
MQLNKDAEQAAEDPEEPKRRAEGIGGLVKGLAIIEAFGPSRPRLTISDAAKVTGITPAAARRCLLTLESLGYLTHDGKYFRATPRITRLGAAYAEVSTLPTLAHPCLSNVRDEIGETSSLAVLDGDSSLFVARAEAVHMVAAGVRVGARLPAYASASGRVLLSGLTEPQLEQNLAGIQPVASTKNTLVTISDIRRRVEEARVEGVSFTDEELELGVRTMAVPVKDSAGRVHAAMTVSASAGRIPLQEMRERFLPVLRAEAARLGKML